MAPPMIEPTALPKLNATCTVAPPSSSPPPLPASAISSCCGEETKNNPNAIQKVRMAQIAGEPGTKNTNSNPTPEIACPSAAVPAWRQRSQMRPPTRPPTTMPKPASIISSGTTPDA